MVENMKTEDSRLKKIRYFKGTFIDFLSYIDSRIEQTKSEMRSGEIDRFDSFMEKLKTLH